MLPLLLRCRCGLTKAKQHNHKQTTKTTKQQYDIPKTTANNIDGQEHRLEVLGLRPGVALGFIRMHSGLFRFAKLARAALALSATAIFDQSTGSLSSRKEYLKETGMTNGIQFRGSGMIAQSLES